GSSASDRATGRRGSFRKPPKLTRVGADGIRRIADRPPLTFHDLRITAETDTAAMTGYAATLLEDRQVLLRRYRTVDAAITVAGVGSVGLLTGILLLEAGEGKDPLFLDVRQAESSVLERHLGPSSHEHRGERIVAGQRRFQGVSDVLLGWTTG